LIGVLGSLLGFLYYNWNPSKLYMGDTGSQFLGIFLAAMSILFFWNPHYTSDNIPTKQIISVIVIFILPLADTTTVVINRLSRGQSPFVGGKDHTTHHLSYMGLTDRKVALVIVSLSLLTILLAYFLFTFTSWGWLHISLFSAFFLAVFSTLFYITKTKKAIE